MELRELVGKINETLKRYRFRNQPFRVETEVFTLDYQVESNPKHPVNNLIFIFKPKIGPTAILAGRKLFLENPSQPQFSLPHWTRKLDTDGTATFWSMGQEDTFIAWLEPA